MKTSLKISLRLLATLLCLALLIVSLPQALLAQAGEILGGYDPEPAAEEETGTTFSSLAKSPTNGPLTRKPFGCRTAAMFSRTMPNPSILKRTVSGPITTTR